MVERKSKPIVAYHYSRFKISVERVQAIIPVLTGFQRERTVQENDRKLVRVWVTMKIIAALR